MKKYIICCPSCVSFRFDLGIIQLACLKPFPAKHAKHAKSMPGEATVLRTGGCPAIDGSKGFLSAVSPGALRRPLRVRRLHRHGQDRSGSLATARNEVTRKAVRKGVGGKHGFPDDGWPDGRADALSAGGRRDAGLFRVFRVFRGKHHPITFVVGNHVGMLTV